MTILGREPRGFLFGRDDRPGRPIENLKPSVVRSGDGDHRPYQDENSHGFEFLPGDRYRNSRRICKNHK